LKGAPKNSDLHYVIAAAFDGKKDWKKAVEHFKKVAPDSKFYSEATVHITFLYQKH